MKVRIPALLLAFALAPGLARATDLQLGLEVAGEYDDNVFASDQNPVGDWLGRFGPRLVVIDETGAFQWQLRYAPRYKKYVHQGDLDGWDQDALARLTWDLSPRTRLSLSDRFLDYDNFSQLFSQDLLPDGTIDTGIELGRQSFRQNALSASLEHQLEPRHLIQFGLSRYDNRFGGDRTESSESQVTEGSAAWVYTLRPTDLVGLVGRVTRQTIQQGVAQSDFDTDYYNLSLRWIHEFDPTLNMSIEAGPTWTRQDARRAPDVIEDARRFPVIDNSAGLPAPVRASSCPRLDDGTLFLGEGCEGFEFPVFSPVFDEAVDLPRLGDSPSAVSSLTYFASASLTKRWNDFAVVLRYDRDASTTSEVAGIVRDDLSVSVIWTPARRWNVTFSALYEIREQPGESTRFVEVLVPTTVAGLADVGEAVGFRDVQVDNSNHIKGYVLGVYANYTLTRRTQLFFNASWYSESSSGDLIAKRSLDRFRATVGFIYWLPTLQLPI